jgi:hypothetical protein
MQRFQVFFRDSSESLKVLFRLRQSLVSVVSRYNAIYSLPGEDFYEIIDVFRYGFTVKYHHYLPVSFLGHGFSSFIGCPQYGQSVESGIQEGMKGRLRPSLLAFSLMAFFVLPGSWDTISSMVLSGRG